LVGDTSGERVAVAGDGTTGERPVGEAISPTSYAANNQRMAAARKTENSTRRMTIDLTEANGEPAANGSVSAADVASAKNAVDANERMALLAHEIRASLTAIKGFGITLREHYDELRPADRALAIDAIVRGSDTLLQLADDLLASGRAEAGVLRLKYDRVDMAAVARHVIEAERRLHPRVDFALTVDADITVAGDTATLARALDNLIRNAVRHAPAGSCIDVEGTRVLDTIVMAVRNDGPPIPAEIREHLFEKYSGISEGGTGLGLYLTRLIVEAHGGSAWYSHDADGNRFALVLPIRRAAKKRRVVRL